MKKLILLAVLALFPFAAQAAGGGCGELPHCLKAPVNLKDQESLQRGASLFVSYCLGCHTAKYVRYQRLGDDLGIPKELVEQNLMFTTDKVGEQMRTGTSQKEQAKWFGAAPPDLTLETRLRSSDWVYSYLLSFYPDEKRPFGVNNKVFKDVAMPHALETLERELGEDGYKAAVGDLVNFMTYMAEPSQVERKSIGVWVLLFLVVLFVPVYLLNKEYWKDVK